MKLRFFLYSISFLALIFSVVLRVKQVEKERAKPIPSSLSIMQKEGKPVILSKVKDGVNINSLRYIKNTPHLFFSKGGSAKFLPVKIQSFSQEKVQISPQKDFLDYVEVGASLLEDGDLVFALAGGLK